MKYKTPVESIKNNKGFTLIELLISLAIFSIAMLAIASAQIGTINANNKSRRYTEAAIVAQGQVEMLMNTVYDDPLLTEGNHDGGMFNSRYAVTWTVDPEVDNTKTVHLTVEWTDVRQKDIIFDFVTAEY